MGEVTPGELSAALFFLVYGPTIAAVGIVGATLSLLRCCRGPRVPAARTLRPLELMRASDQ